MIARPGCAGESVWLPLETALPPCGVGNDRYHRGRARKRHAGAPAHASFLTSTPTRSSPAATDDERAGILTHSKLPHAQCQCPSWSSRVSPVRGWQRNMQLLGAASYVYYARRRRRRREFNRANKQYIYARATLCHAPSVTASSSSMQLGRTRTPRSADHTGVRS